MAMAAALPVNFLVRNTFIELEDEAEAVFSPNGGNRRRSMPPKLHRSGGPEDMPLRRAPEAAPTAERRPTPRSPTSQLGTASSTRSSLSGESPGHAFSPMSPGYPISAQAFVGLAGSPGAGLFEADTAFFAMEQPVEAARLALERFVQRVPTPAAPPMFVDAHSGCDASVGSQGHATRDCRPCAFVRSAAGCKFGTACNFCHVVGEHPEAVRVRPCKGKRERLKRQLQTIEKAVAQDPDLLASGSLTLPALVDRNSKTHARVMAHLAQVAANAYQGLSGDQSA